MKGPQIGHGGGQTRPASIVPQCAHCRALVWSGFRPSNDVMPKHQANRPTHQFPRPRTSMLQLSELLSRAPNLCLAAFDFRSATKIKRVDRSKLLLAYCTLLSSENWGDCLNKTALSQESPKIRCGTKLLA